MSNEIAVPVKFETGIISFDEQGVIAKVQNLIEPYEGITPEQAASMDSKEQKACRADLNRISKELNDARKTIKKAYTQPLSAFEAKVKEIDAMIKGPCEIIDRAIKIREDKERQDRISALYSAYMDYAPILAEAVPFERIMEPQWANASYGAKKAEKDMIEKVSRIADDLKTLETMQLAFPDEAKAVFLRTLSLRDARDHDAMRKAEAERIKAMERQKEEIKAAYEAPESRSEVPFRCGMSILCTESQFELLKTYMVSNGIKIERIEKE